MEFWPGVIIPRWIVTRVTIPRQNVTPGHNSTLNCDPGQDSTFKCDPAHNSTLNCDPGYWFHVEVRPQVSIQRWIVTPSHDSTLNCHLVLGSQFNVEFWPRVIIQRGILTRGYNSTWNSDPSTYLVPVELRLKKVSKFNSVIKIQQLRRVTIQRKIHWILTPGRYSIGGSKFYLTPATAIHQQHGQKESIRISKDATPTRQSEFSKRTPSMRQKWDPKSAKSRRVLLVRKVSEIRMPAGRCNTSFINWMCWAILEHHSNVSSRHLQTN